MFNGITSLPLTPLTFGAAALGQVYGVANPQEMITEEAARALLDQCWREGLRSIDTAAAYGEAEERIGRWAAEGGLEPVIITKAPPLEMIPDEAVPAVLAKLIDASRSKLQVSVLDGYLLHRGSDWRRVPVRAALRDAQAQGKLRAVGVSSYDAGDAMALLDIEAFDIVQIPFGLFDRRAKSSGLLDRAGEMNIAVCARSVFLQGLLFLDPHRLPADLRAAAPHLAALRKIASEAECDLTSLAILGALNAKGIATVVIGLYSAEQVGQAVQSAAARLDEAMIQEAIEIAGNIPAEIQDPRRWRQH